MSLAFRATAAFLAVVVTVGAVIGVRWWLAWDDLPSYAKPAGFEQIDHRLVCGNGADEVPFVDRLSGDGCKHRWIYVSNEVIVGDAFVALNERFVQRGWGLRPYSGDCCLIVYPSEERCFIFANARDAWWSKDIFQPALPAKADEFMAVIEIRNSCG